MNIMKKKINFYFKSKLKYFNISTLYFCLITKHCITHFHYVFPKNKFFFLMKHCKIHHLQFFIKLLLNICVYWCHIQKFFVYMNHYNHVSNLVTNKKYKSCHFYMLLLLQKV